MTKLHLKEYIGYQHTEHILYIIPVGGIKESVI